MLVTYELKVEKSDFKLCENSYQLSTCLLTSYCNIANQLFTKVWQLQKQLRRMFSVDLQVLLKLIFLFVLNICKAVCQLY